MRESFVFYYGRRGSLRKAWNVAVRSLLSRAFRKTPSTPSAADSESSPVGIERAFGSYLKRRGRRFAESDAFFGGAGSGADKFRLLPQISAYSVVKNTDWN